MIERVACGVGRRQHLDVEPLEQRAGTKLRRLQLLGDRVVYERRGGGIQLALNAEYFVQHVLKPRTRGRSAKELPMIDECLPDSARIRLGVRWLAVYWNDAEPLERHA